MWTNPTKDVDDVVDPSPVGEEVMEEEDIAESAQESQEAFKSHMSKVQGSFHLPPLKPPS